VPIGLRLAIVILGTVAAAPVCVAGAAPAFNGNVCGLLTAKQATAISGVSSKCTNAKPSQGLGSKIYIGNWSGLKPTSPTLQVTIAVYGDAGALQLATRNLKQGLPGGPPKKVSGIGEAAYEATGAMGAGIHVAVGKNIAYISLSTPGTTPKSAAVVEPVAKAVAARL
jgi:hypothetical protein